MTRDKTSINWDITFFNRDITSMNWDINSTNRSHFQITGSFLPLPTPLSVIVCVFFQFSSYIEKKILGPNNF